MRCSNRSKRAVDTTWAGSLAAAAFCLFCLKHDEATVFCKAGEVGSSNAAKSAASGATSGDANKSAHVHRSAMLGRRLGSDSGGLNAESRAASAERDAEDIGATPEQIHLSLAASSPDSEEYGMTVAWTTWPETESTVLWGTTPEEMLDIAHGSSTSYSADHPGRTPYTSGFLHSATMTALQPSRTYYYTCGDETLEMSSVRSFITPPTVGAEQAVTLGILGDLGQTDDSERTLAVIEADKSLHLILHAGDLSYADCDQPRWDSFLRMLDPVASRLPWMVSAGNHEIEAGSFGGKPFVAYEKRFRMPAAAPPAQSYECGRGGGLDGNADGGRCWAGLGADEAQSAATQEAMRLRYTSQVPEEGARMGSVSVGGKEADKAVAAAARRVRENFDVDAQPQPGSKGREGVNVSGDGGEVQAAVSEPEAKPVSCCPSEWSGTYDFGNSFYSFDVGSVHVVVLNPYAATGENSVQHEWVQKDLEDTDRTLTPWVIAMFHCPWYNSNLAHQGERQQETSMRVMEPLLNKHKVAVVVSGHVHAYERSYPVVDHELSEDGPTYLVVGGAGNREGHAAGFYPQPQWSAFRDGTAYGSGRLAIRDPSLALWEWTSTEEGSSVHDVVWITNPYSPAEPRISIAAAYAEQQHADTHPDGASGPSREALDKVHMMSKLQQQELEERKYSARTDEGDGRDRVHHKYGHTVGGGLRIPGLVERHQRFS